MNKNILFFLVLLLSSSNFYSCGSDDENPFYWTRNYWGEISITRNGEALDLLIAGLDHDMRDEDIFHIRPGMAIDVGEYKDEMRIGSIVFTQIPCERGVYPIETNEVQASLEPTVSYFTLVESDVAGDRYITDSSKINFISIDSITNDNQVFGHFELNLSRDTSRIIQLPFLPDDYKFECEYFHTRLE
jgi:hypothetical protein